MENINRWPCVLVDIDGTLAIRETRGPHDLSLVIEDRPRLHMDEVLECFESHLYVIYVSGRQEQARAQTEYWLKVHGFPKGAALLMRTDGDNRQDAIVKAEMLDKIKQSYEVVVVLDDRDQCVKMWRSRGLLCLQVEEGNF
ncbi:MAG: hypothetical protein R3B95_11725 [Nitrospirales bacterium]|nr:hypothetical protein [Nitrospirales bacterium]